MIRNIYLKKVSARLDEMEAEIEYLRAKADTAKAGESCGRQLDYMSSGTETVREMIRAIREVEGANWGKLKAGVEQGLENLRKSLDSVYRELERIPSNNR